MRVYAVFLLSVFICVIALAVAGVRAGDEATRIEVDEQHNVMRFVVDGQVRAVLDGTALHVRGDINYGGSITDYGGTGFDMQTGAGAGDAQ